MIFVHFLPLREFNSEPACIFRRGTATRDDQPALLVDWMHSGYIPLDTGKILVLLLRSSISLNTLPE